MKYVQRNFDYLTGTKGFSKDLLQNHFTLYQGYATNVNAILETLNELVKNGKTGTREYLALRKNYGWEFNGMRLHELYFGNMTNVSGKVDIGTPFCKKISEDFGSWENWEKDFKACGTTRGIGWTILYYDPEGNCFFNAWINEHDTGHLCCAYPVLVMDVFEHAFMLDYGLKRADYIETFFNAIDWSVVNHRYDAAVKSGFKLADLVHKG